MAPVKQELWQCGGLVGTEVLLINSEPEPQLRVLVVPGNPGQAGYYVPFLESLHSSLSGHASVLAISHLGMHSSGQALHMAYSLEDQIHHKVVIIQHLLSLDKTPLVILAHSIGTYMCIHALNRLENRRDAADAALAVHLDPTEAQMFEASIVQDLADSAHSSGDSLLKYPSRRPGKPNCAEETRSRVVKLIGLFPFLALNPSCSKQSSIRSLATWYMAAGQFAAVISKLPKKTQRWLLQRVSPNLEDHAAETAQQLVNSRCVRNSLFLAKCEFEDLPTSPDWSLILNLGSRFAVLCCPNDHWMPECMFQQLLQDVPGVEAYWEQGQCHAFCISEAKSYQVAEKVVKIIDDTGVLGLNRGV